MFHTLDAQMLRTPMRSSRSARDAAAAQRYTLNTHAAIGNADVVR